MSSLVRTENFDDVLSRITASAANNRPVSVAIPIPTTSFSTSHHTATTDHVAASLQSIHRAVAEGNDMAMANSIETKGIREDVLAQQLVLESIKTTGENNAKQMAKMKDEVLARLDQFDQTQQENLVQIATAMQQLDNRVTQEGEAGREHTTRAKETIVKKIDDDGEKTRNEFRRNSRGTARMVLTLSAVLLGVCLVATSALAGFVVGVCGVGIVQVLPDVAIDHFCGWFVPASPLPVVDSASRAAELLAEAESGVEMSVLNTHVAQAPTPTSSISKPFAPASMGVGLVRRVKMTN